MLTTLAPPGGNVKGVGAADVLGVVFEEAVVAFISGDRVDLELLTDTVKDACVITETTAIEEDRVSIEVSS